MEDIEILEILADSEFEDEYYIEILDKENKEYYYIRLEVNTEEREKSHYFLITKNDFNFHAENENFNIKAEDENYSISRIKDIETDIKYFLYRELDRLQELYEEYLITREKD